jgi:hypothetical protein
VAGYWRRAIWSASIGRFGPLSDAEFPDEKDGPFRLVQARAADGTIASEARDPARGGELLRLLPLSAGVTVAVAGLVMAMPGLASARWSPQASVAARAGGQSEHLRPVKLVKVSSNRSWMAADRSRVAQLAAAQTGASVYRIQQSRRGRTDVVQRRGGAELIDRRSGRAEPMAPFPCMLPICVAPPDSADRVSGLAEAVH